MRWVTSYRSGIDRRQQRLQGRTALGGSTALGGLAILGMLLPVSLGCTSPHVARGNLTHAPAATALGFGSLTARPPTTAAANVAPGSANSPAVGEGEDPRLVAAFARLEQVRAEREPISAAPEIAAQPSLHTDASQTQQPPASELLPGATMASIPVWPRMQSTVIRTGP